MKWSPEQDAALCAVRQWLRASKRKQIFRLFGFAGTGKTTLAKQIAADIKGEVLFGAFTGKAASVLRSKGCAGAATIHSMIYGASEGTSTDADGAESLLFELNRNSRVGRADLVIIDECSMVDAALGNDLLSFDTPVLVLGDPFQLPPVRGEGFFTSEKPDVMLTEIHRQARDNPIIRMSIDIREGGTIRRGEYGTSAVKTRRELAPEEVIEADQVLVGRNDTRSKYNRRFREIKQFEDRFPVKGDRLVCLRNNRKSGLLNGMLCDVVKVGSGGSKDTLKMTVRISDQEGRADTKVTVLPECFAGGLQDLLWEERKPFDEFDFGYALTVHKSQGSQWDNVCLFDESDAFRKENKRWLYTGVTRAAERITVVM